MKTYTFRLLCSFEMQYSFTESEVGPDTEGGESDVVPTEAVLAALIEEMQATICQHITSFAIHVESDDLLGTEDHAA